MAITYQVQFAVYGALFNGDENDMRANDVTGVLQDQLNNSSSGVLNINNDTMGGDPCVGYTKAFGALVVVADDPKWFACTEGQTIDFS